MKIRILDVLGANADLPISLASMHSNAIDSVKNGSQINLHPSLVDGIIFPHCIHSYFFYKNNLRNMNALIIIDMGRNYDCSFQSDSVCGKDLITFAPNFDLMGIIITVNTIMIYKLLIYNISIAKKQKPIKEVTITLPNSPPTSVPFIQNDHVIKTNYINTSFLTHLLPVMISLLVFITLLPLFFF